MRTERPNRTVGKAPSAIRRWTVRIDIPPSWCAVSARVQRTLGSGASDTASLALSGGFALVVTLNLEGRGSAILMNR